jgi:hypothetical protein
MTHSTSLKKTLARKTGIHGNGQPGHDAQSRSVAPSLPCNGKVKSLPIEDQLHFDEVHVDELVSQIFVPLETRSGSLEASVGLLLGESVDDSSYCSDDDFLGPPKYFGRVIRHALSNYRFPDKEVCDAGVLGAEVASDFMAELLLQAAFYGDSNPSD